jgi:competence protein ComEC
MSEKADNDNDNSIITLLECRDFKMLFTGDVRALLLESIINKLPKDITVLKVPHHGAVGSVSKEIVSTYSSVGFPSSSSFGVCLTHSIIIG